MEDNMTKNFKREEFLRSQKAIEQKIDNSLPKELETNLRYSSEKIQSVRDFVGKGITITSGYRCPALNKVVNGATNSDHMTMLALDFYVTGYTKADHQRLMELMLKRPDVRYMTIYPDNRLHVSWKIV